MKSLPDTHSLIAASRLLDVEFDWLVRQVERYVETDGYTGPDFDLDYHAASRLTGVPVATLRTRVHRGQYVEGRDYVRKGPRTVYFSRRIIKETRPGWQPRSGR